MYDLFEFGVILKLKGGLKYLKLIQKNVYTLEK